MIHIQTSQLSRFHCVSHGFTAFLRSHGRFFIFHGFTNFTWIFSQTRNFLRKKNKVTQSLVKNHRSIVLYMQKKKIIIIILQSLIERLALGAFLEAGVPRISKTYIKNIHQGST